MKVLSLLMLFLYSLRAEEETPVVTLPLAYKPFSRDQLFLHAEQMRKSLSKKEVVSDADPINDPEIFGEYSCTAKLGSHSQELNLVLDSANSNVWVSLLSCKGCPLSKRFDSDNSDTYHHVDSKFHYITYHLGNYYGEVKGNLAQDVFEITRQGTVDDFYFIGVTEASGNLFSDFELPFHGGIGFSHSSFTDMNGIVYQFYSKGLIRLLEMGFAFKEEEAAITFGGKDQDMYSSMTSFKHLETGDLWTMSMASLKYGRSNIQDATGALSASLLFHTPLILLPTLEYNYMLRELNDKEWLACDTDKESSLLICFSEIVLDFDHFDSLTFTFRSMGKDHDFVVPPMNFINITESGHLAIFKIMCVDGLDYIGLGTSFMKNLYLHLNAEHNEISIGWGLDYESSMAGWIFLLILMACVMVGCGGSYGGYKRYAR